MNIRYISVHINMQSESFTNTNVINNLVVGREPDFLPNK